MAAKKRRKRRHKRGYSALKTIDARTADDRQVSREVSGTQALPLYRDSAGALYPIYPADADAKKQDLFEIRRILHAGGEPIRDRHAQLFTRWRHWCVMRDDFEKGIEAGKGNKWTRKLLKRSGREIGEAWRDLGAALSAMRMSDEELHEQMAILCKAARPAKYAWQKAATDKIIAQQAIDNVRLSERKVDPEIAQWLLANVQRVNLTARQLNKHLREQGHTMTPRAVSRFVLDTLQVTLRSERGKRTDLMRGKRRSGSF